MLIRVRDSHPRSISKAVSWRILGSIDTFALSFIFTGSFKLAGSIALTEMFTKMFLYTSMNGSGPRFPGANVGSQPSELIQADLDVPDRIDHSSPMPSLVGVGIKSNASSRAF